MIAPGCLYVAVLSSIDGEQFVGDQGYNFDEQSRSTLLKASIAWDHPCFLFTLIHKIHVACVALVGIL